MSEQAEPGPVPADGSTAHTADDTVAADATPASVPGGSHNGGPGMQTHMSLSVDQNGRLPVVHVIGEIDDSTAPVLAAALDGKIGAGHRELVLDLGAVTFLDSRGIGILVSRHRQLRRQNGALSIANASQRALSVLAVTGLDRVFTLYPSVSDALGGDHVQRGKRPLPHPPQ